MKKKNIVGKNVLGSEIRQWSSTGCNRLPTGCSTGCNRLPTGCTGCPDSISGSSSELRWSWALIFYSFVVLSSTWKLPSMGFQLPLSSEIEFLCTGCNRLPDWVWFQKFPHPVSQSSSEILYSDFFFTSCPTSQLCYKKGFSSIGLLEQIWHPYKDATVRSPPPQQLFSETGFILWKNVRMTKTPRKWTFHDNIWFLLKFQLLTPSSSRDTIFSLKLFFRQKKLVAGRKWPRPLKEAFS